MTTTVYDFVEVPKGKMYHDLLNCAPNFSSEFLLVLRPSISVDESANALIAALNPFLISKFELDQWPGTKLLEEVASVYKFKVCAPAIEVLRGASDSLFDWQQPRLPEDLCFLRATGAPWLVTIAHEEDAYFEMSPDEKENLENAVNGLQLNEHIDDLEETEQ